MKKLLLAVVVAGLVASSANAAILSLVADDGGGMLDLGPGATGNMHIDLSIHAIDVDGFAFANVFLNDEDNDGDGKLNVVDWMAGFDEPAGNLVYDDTSFSLPADISHDLNNEYALIMGRNDGLGWGAGSYRLVTLSIMNTSAELGEHPITFEKGARSPQIFTPGFLGYVWGTGFAGVIPHFADPGVGGEFDPFIIRNVPEPATLALVAFGGLALLRRR